MEQERLVKGLWIPIEIWKDTNLSWNEKILFLEIDSFTSADKDCYISNEYIAQLLGVSETRANKILSSLISKGYVIKTSFDGRKRYVKSALSLTTRQGCPFGQGRVEQNDNILNTITNIEEKEIDKSISKKKGCDEFVERMYALYPAKCPMRNHSLGKSSKDKNRIAKLLKTYTESQIEMVIQHEIDEKYGKSYMQNFSTFLNNFPDPSCIDDAKEEVSTGESTQVVINGQIYK
jgi:biotin operon repressor